MDQPRPYHHGHLDEALVQAGFEAARAGGPGALALRDLAKTVGVSPAAAYRHFPSLDHLVAAVAQLAREHLARAMIAERDLVPDDGTADAAWARFMGTGRAYVHLGVTEPRLFETGFTPCPAPPSRPDDPAAWDVLVEAIDALVLLGEIPADRRPTAPLVAWSAVHGLASIVAGDVMPDGPSLETSLDAVLLGVRRALGQRVLRDAPAPRA